MSPTFSKIEKLNSWGTTPIRRLAVIGSASMSTPKIDTCPPVLITSEQITPMVVDLPAPFGPSSAKKSPSSTHRSMPFRASKPPA